MSEWRECESRWTCDETAAELSRLKERTTWQPIEMAPKDGTPILAGSSPGQWVCSAFYEEDGRQGWYEVGSHWTDAIDGSVDPTHWMPLFDPPK